MKRFDEALKIYDYGLKNLDPENEGLQVIASYLIPFLIHLISPCR